MPWARESSFLAFDTAAGRKRIAFIPWLARGVDRRSIHAEQGQDYTRCRMRRTPSFSADGRSARAASLQRSMETRNMLHSIDADAACDALISADGLRRQPSRLDKATPALRRTKSKMRHEYNNISSSGIYIYEK